MTISQTVTVYSGDVPDKDTMTPEEFDTAAQDWVDYQTAMAAEVNTWAGEANTLATTINGYKADAQAAQAGAESAESGAISAKNAAEDAVISAAAAANASIYDAGTTYAAGDVVQDPGDDYMFYTSQQGSNTGHTPNTDDGTWWVVTTVDATDMDNWVQKGASDRQSPLWSSSLGKWAPGYPSSLFSDSRTSNAQLAASDNGTIINITSGTFTQTLVAAATLGDGWYCYIKNSGTGEITLDPDGSETIDSLTSFKMYPGEMRLIQCDGTEFFSHVMKSFYKAFTSTGTFTKPPGYTMFKGLLWGAGSSGGRGGYNGGAGGACRAFELPASDFASTEAVTIGAGGAARTTNGAQNVGGDSTLGSLVTGYGAGTIRGGGWLSGGYPIADGSTNDNSGMGGANTNNSGAGNSVFGGAGGGRYDSTTHQDGGDSIYGGAGGGANKLGDDGTGGSSKHGGDGGNAGRTGTPATAGTAPGGGGGASEGVDSGAGARGELRIWGII